MDRQLLEEAMEALEAPPRKVDRLQFLPYHEAVRVLEEMKERATELYNRYAFEWHPDRNPQDPRAPERLKALNIALTELKKVQVLPCRTHTVRAVHFPNVTPSGSSVSVTDTNPFRKK